ncbi:hypothetical protein [Marinomonas shanghaiensis]|uniref:hypothetical protein n=1 Tax=Marinomonas shanghaiensis TaxID=2202418 RepID=UPI003A942A9B
MNWFTFDIPTVCLSNKRLSTIQSLSIGMASMSLVACALFSNDGYHGGDHRSGGPTGPLSQ